MVQNTLSRDYDIARILEDYRKRIEALERAALLDPVSAAIWQSIPGGFDTGWQNIVSFDPEFTPQTGGNTPQIRRFGPLVMVRGRVDVGSTAISGSVIYTIPSGFNFAPPGIAELGRSLLPGAANYAHRYYMTAGGDGSVQGLAGTSDTFLSLSGLYAVSAPFPD